MSSVRVLFFSVLRDKIGRGFVELDLREATTVGELLDELIGTYPAIDPYRGSIRMAVNQTYVDAGHPVEVGDEIALITPVSGG